MIHNSRIITIIHSCYDSIQISKSEYEFNSIKVISRQHIEKYGKLYFMSLDDEAILFY